MSYQMSLFDLLNNRKEFKIDKPIRLIELFAGYGSQHFALEYLGANFESYKICEWAVKSIQAYKDAHFSHDNTDYSKGLSKDEIDQFLFKKGISSNYNEPMSFEQIKRLGEDKKRAIYNNIIATHNLVSVVNCKASDLEIVERDKYTYLMTYSFPCQDLSKAGQMKGMSKGGGTRSGMLWQVERILDECHGNLPHVLVMENVPDVIGEKNKQDFARWYQKLEDLGYANFYEVLNAKHFGIPQNHARCFMVSILGDYFYSFPAQRKLEIRLKDLLEKNVDEKFYLSEKMKQYITNTNEKWIGNNNNSAKINRDIAVTITTRVGNTRADSSDYLSEDLPDNMPISNIRNKHLRETLEKVEIEDGDFLDTYNRANRKNIAGTLSTRTNSSNDTYVVVKDENALTENHGEVTAIAIRNNTKKGYLLASDGDGVNINSRMKHQRGNVQKDMALTIKTQPDVGVVVQEETYENAQPKCIGGIGEKKSNGGTQWYQQDRIYDNTVSLCVSARETPYYPDSQLRIRKLTPKECFRLMGVRDEDFERIAVNQSNASLYHLAGDSIVVDVLMYIFKQMLETKEE